MVIISTHRNLLTINIKAYHGRRHLLDKLPGFKIKSICRYRSKVMDTISIIALWFTGLPVLIVIYLMMRQKGLKYLFWNSLKIIIWIGYCVILVKWLGKYEGAILYALLVVVWGWVVTLRGVRKGNRLGAEWSDAKWKFSTDFFLPFTVHGCYCSPGWGVDGRTNGLTPID